MRLGILMLIALALIVPGPLPAGAQSGTPAAESGLDQTVSPAALYDLILDTPFPEDLLPAGIPPLQPYEWGDANDPDLAGSVGGVIFADGDPFGSVQPTSIAYMVFPDAGGPEAPLATAGRFATPYELTGDDVALPALLLDTGDLVGIFSAVDYVLIYSLVPAGEDDAIGLAEELILAGVTHLARVTAASAGAVTESDPGATPITTSQDPERILAALAGAPFPADDLPFPVGSLVVLPTYVTPAEVEAGLVGAVVVRDADRVYPYPLVMYRVYRDDIGPARYVDGHAGGEVRIAPAAADEGDTGYPALKTELANDTARILVQIGNVVVVVGDAPSDSAIPLARVAVGHLELALAGVAAAESADTRSSASLSPVRLYDLLLASSFPDDLLPAGTPSLTAYQWRDSNDADLAGAIGGVIFAAADPFGSDYGDSITYVVYPDSQGAAASFEEARSYAATIQSPAEPCVAGVASLLIDAGDAIICFVQVDNVVIYGLVPTSPLNTLVAEIERATALAEAGITFLEELIGGSAGAAAPAEPERVDTSPSPLSGMRPAAVSALLHAAEFPAELTPAGYGPFVVFPMPDETMAEFDTAVGAVVVSDRRDPMESPIPDAITYWVYQDAAAAELALERMDAAAEASGVPATEVVDFGYPAYLIEFDGVSGYFMQIDFVFMAAVAQPDGGEGPAAGRALTLAEAGIAHLERLR